MHKASDSAFLAQHESDLLNLLVNHWHHHPEEYSPQSSLAMIAWRHPDNTTQRPCYITISAEQNSAILNDIAKKLNEKLNMQKKHVQMMASGFHFIAGLSAHAVIERIQS